MYYDTSTSAIIQIVVFCILSLLMARISRPKWIGYFRPVCAWLTYVVACLLFMHTYATSNPAITTFIAFNIGSAVPSAILGFIVGYIAMLIIVAIMRKHRAKQEKQNGDDEE